MSARQPAKAVTIIAAMMGDSFFKIFYLNLSVIAALVTGIAVVQWCTTGLLCVVADKLSPPPKSSDS